MALRTIRRDIEAYCAPYRILVQETDSRRSASHCQLLHDALLCYALNMLASLCLVDCISGGAETGPEYCYVLWLFLLPSSQQHSPLLLYDMLCCAVLAPLLIVLNPPVLSYMAPRCPPQCAAVGTRLGLRHNRTAQRLLTAPDLNYSGDRSNIGPASRCCDIKMDLIHTTPGPSERVLPFISGPRWAMDKSF